MKVPSLIPLPVPSLGTETVAHYSTKSPDDASRKTIHISGDQFNRLLGDQVERLRQLIFQLDPRSTSDSTFSCVIESSDAVEVAVSALACWRLGGHVVLPPNLRPTTIERLTNRITLEGKRCIVTSAELFLNRQPMQVADKASNSEPALDQLAQRPLAEVDSDALLLTCYTSGTTGEPEAAHKTARQILGEARLLASLFMTTPGFGVACSVPAHHLYGFLFGVLAPLYGRQILAGGSGPERPSLKALSSSLREPQLVSVPVHLRSLLSTQRELLAGYRCCYSSSAPLPKEVGTEIINLSAQTRLVEIFGSSETGGIATRENDPGGIWKPLPGMKVDADENGLLTLQSPFAPKASAIESGIDSTFTTSDSIELVNDGFRHLGRKDGVVKIGGKRICLQDLEARAAEQADVRDVACVTLPSHGLRHQEIGMVLVPRDLQANHIAFKQDVRNRLREHFDDVVIPRRIRISTALPRKTTGKLETSELVSLFETSKRGDEHSKTTTQPPPLAGFGNFRITSHQEALGSPDPHFEYEIQLLPEQIWFQGHFPQFPVLPGVVQLHSLVLACAQARWIGFERLRSQRQIKFKRPLVPGDTLRVHLAPQLQPRRLAFSIDWLSNPASSDSGPVPAASGVLYFDE